ncbi:putative alpha/Beta hydrolase [Rosa chinensis]|uniref:Putative alpha/Beta hydrolase n=1 Tax=Rosa chinensis TaxID=74649 RepID=A0A2P6QXE2_ROSCH|nr:putative alpha/Beta hydrolase [Rosa chinensis]
MVSPRSSCVGQRAAARTRGAAEKGYEDAKSVLAALKSQGVSAIGAAGFCWGGKPFITNMKWGLLTFFFSGNVVAKLAKSDDIKAL